MAVAASRALLLYTVAAAALLFPAVVAQLSPNFYRSVCPQALPTIRRVVKKAIDDEPRMGASLLRLHFHDCFVNGCDGSVLLDDTSTFTGEKTANPNLNSIRGFDVVDKIKKEVDRICRRSVVSCADILAVAARDSVSIARIYNDTNIQTNLASSLQRACPLTGGDNNLQPLDGTPAGFDTQYFGSLVRNRGLLHSDQELFGTGSAASDALVRLYSGNPARFAADFAASMVKMGNMGPLTGSNGEIRTDCRKIN
ncbi:unnamed protein product [Linum tenue]|uniref:peroxidase n=1 Tax=Linum tenue TaxID=586396 RepID=A0AAV0IRV8_9ROSI|nr:unnamed protein product [Linum tenue]